MLLFSLIVFYCVCCFLSYGLTFAYFQRKYPVIAKSGYRTDVVTCTGLSLFGPISLLITFFMYERGIYGFKIK